MMELKDKYSKLTDYLKNSQIKDLSILEKDGVLYISGKTTSGTKDKIWEIYNEIDPDMRSGDIVLDISLDESELIYEVKSGDSLSKIAQNYPNMSWQKIYEANKDIIKDPNVIFPGQKLKIPQE